MTKIMKFIGFTILVGLVGCAQGPETSQVKVSIAAVTGSAQFPGGLYLMGKHESGKKFIRVVRETDSIELELENGKWDFASMGWDSTAQHFEGNSFCGLQQGMELKGSDIALDLKATKENCNNKIFGSQVSNNNFYPLQFHTCGDIQDYILKGSTIPPNLECGPTNSDEMFSGGLKSFKISLKEVREDGSIKDGLSSRCINDLGSDAKELSAIRLPHGSPFVQLPYEIKGYSDVGCNDGDIQTSYKFLNGFVDPAGNGLGVDVPDGLNSILNVYLHSDICSPAQVKGSPFAASTGTNHLICTVDQFQNIVNNPSDSFKIGTDINMSGNITVSTFSGKLDGGNNTLYDGDSPLFEIITSSPGQVEIEDLVIENFEITNASVPNQDAFGILSHSILASGNTIKIQDITIDDQSTIALTNSSFGTPTYLGALAGKADALVSLTIRGVQSGASVNAVDANANVRVGGLIGIVNGNGAKSNIKIEDTSVGSKDLKSNIEGIQRVGGLVGQAFECEISEGVQVFVNIMGKTTIGGLIGDVEAGLEIQNAYVQSIYRPVDPNNVTNIGGVIGSISGDHNISIDGVYSDFSVPAPVPSFGQTVTKLGGIVGAASSYAASSYLRIQNVKVVIDSSMDGSKIGGFIGEYGDSSFSESGDPAVISNSVVEGRIDQESSISSNSERGGFVGKMSSGRLERVIANLELVTGDNKIGGAYGYGDNSYLRESHLNIKEISSTRSSGALHLGGLVGYFNSTAPVGKYFHSLQSNSQLRVENTITNCGTHKCGTLYGELSGTSDSNHFVSIVTTQSIQNQIPLEIHNEDFLCGSNTDCSSGTDVGNITEIATIAPTSACSGLSGGVGFSVNLDSNKCVLSFERAWHKYSNTTDRGSGLYTAGNISDPLHIESPTQWNDIGDDVFLMEKTFELQDDLNFQDLSSTDNIVPIGNNTNRFKGRIIPNGKSLIGLDYTATGNKQGVFSVIDSAIIGWYGDPLVIKGMDLDCGSAQECGTIGSSWGGSIFIVVKDAIVSGSQTDLGGLLGSGHSWLTIKESSFQGKVLGTNQKIGGLVGEFDGKLEIEETAILLDKFTGDNNLGGLVGQFAGSGYADFLSVSNSYILFDPKGENSGDNFNGSTGTQMGVLLGYAASTTTVDVDNFYMDTRKLVIGNGSLSTSWGAGSVGMTEDKFFNIGSPANMVDRAWDTPNIKIKPSNALTDFENNEGEGKWKVSGENLHLAWE